jgi:uncharacterized protein YbjT (DUF2867 family)
MEKAEPQTPAEAEAPRIALTGATGYIGGRLAPRLLQAGYRVRCLVRSARKLDDRPWRQDPRTEVVELDLAEEDRVAEALAGCHAAYYLVHSMQVAGSTYMERDRRLAAAFTRAADRAGVERILYLGGLGETGDRLSKHLASRREVERELARGHASVTILRAAMIIGAGSASFEILRYLVERLPVMITPRWVSTESQPIAVTNALDHLVAALATPETAGRTLDIGGPDVLTYRALMQITAEVLGLPRRWIVPVPVLTPRLSSLWIHLVTPVPYRIARPLGEGLRNRVVCRDARAQELMPQELLSARRAIEDAVASAARNDVETAWSDAGPLPGDAAWAGGTVFADERRAPVAASPEIVFRAVCRIGGGHGWYAADGLWRLRGGLDRLVGGPGLRRGRRQQRDVRVGDALDFWRVTDVKAPHRLEVVAEMKLPGAARLRFRIEPDGENHCTLHQSAHFRPRGLMGLLYWYAVRPLHEIVFRGMLHGIRDAAQAEARAERET